MNVILERAIVSVKKLKNHPRNYRHGDVGAIYESIVAHGQIRPLLVQKSTGYILAGNHTFKALKTAGYTEAVVDYLDVDDEAGLRILAVDNRASGLASNDDHRLAELLQELAETDLGLTGTGYDGDALDELLADLSDSKSAVDEEQLEGDLDTGTVDNPRISRRNGVYWHSMRSFRSNRRKSALKALKQAKDSGDETWITEIARQMAEYIKNTLAIADPKTIVTTTPARDSAFKGIPHFATELAKNVAIATGLEFRQVFDVSAANRRGHHPAREKEPPQIISKAIKPGARVLIIDDMATSGATVEACAKLLWTMDAQVTSVVWVFNAIEGEEESNI